MTKLPEPKTTIEKVHASLVRRRRSEMLLKSAGLAAISFAFLMLLLLVASLVVSGRSAFVQTHITLDVFVDPDEVTIKRLPRGGFDDVLRATLGGLLPDADMADRKIRKSVEKIVSSGAQFHLRDLVVADPDLIGQTVSVTVPVSDPYDQLHKGLIDRDTPQDFHRLSDAEIARFDRLAAQGLITKPLNTGLITNADSRFPELAGLKGALIGSAWALLAASLSHFRWALARRSTLRNSPPNRGSAI